MTPYDAISFQKKDIVKKHLENSAEDLATLAFLNPILLTPLFDILGVSAGWTCQNANNNLSQWEKFGAKKYGKCREFRGLVNKFQSAFKECADDEDKNRLRGLIPEILVYKIVSDRCQKNFFKQKKLYRIEIGCLVDVNGVRVIYNCTNPYKIMGDSDDIKKTVDLGACDRDIGECAEIKVSPNGFHRKDINYLRLLVKELKKNKLNHKVYLVSTGTRDMIESKLKALNLWNPNEFELIGIENFSSLGDASA